MGKEKKLKESREAVEAGPPIGPPPNCKDIQELFGVNVGCDNEEPLGWIPISLVVRESIDVEMACDACDRTDRVPRTPSKWWVCCMDCGQAFCRKCTDKWREK